MRTYLVYDLKTGNIIHKHSQSVSADQRIGNSLDFILKFVGRPYNREDVDYIVVEENQMKAGSEYRVNPETRVLETMG